LESREFPQAVITEKGDGRFAILETNLPYRRAASWDALYEDFDALDIKSGERRRLLTKFRGDTQAGPAGLRLAVLDAATRTLAVDNLATGKRTSIAMEGLSDEQNDVPDLPSFYGVAGWTKDDAELLIYDRFDIWLVDTEARRAPVRLTNGRPTSTQYRVIRIDPDADFLDPNDLLLTSVDERTRDEAIVRRTGNRLTTLWAGAARHQWVGKAKNADTVVMRRATLQESPNLWLTTLAFTSPSKITSLNPQQAQVNWLTVELIEWTSADGERLSGMIFKPENFDYAKKYPMITYFYERLSDTFHAYRSPAPSASTVNIPYFCSNGYVVFVPDIPYKIGYPGESAVSAIVPGVHAVLDRGYVDPKRLGIQGQSWGGYQTVYVISETNLFAAAEAGAPVSNMFSAYGGIRYGSGLVRQFQYERGQSRIDGTPWNSTLRYIENSPIFFADKIRTPLMIMHNDKDGAVPWTQSIELFTALRRLEKPVWLINYNDEDHNLVQRKNRKDLSIRLAQFFDHYLKGAPMPEWMAKGLPAVDKGRTMGLELVKPGN
jgi:dienelactone hydrolase